ncbi:MAG: hypothetical protein ACREDM_11100 [Methylocella sp.]
MSLTYEEMTSRERSAYGGFADAIGGVATIVLAILGLAGLAPATMIGIATIIFGAALLIQGGTMLSEYARIIFPSGAKAYSADHFGGNTLSAVFLVGAAGIVLGLLALLGINSLLTSIAVIAFGTALVLSSNSVWHLHMLKHAAATADSQSPLAGSEILASEMASGSAAMQALAGLAAIVLGILAVAGTDVIVLTLVALLALGATLVMSGSTLSGTVLSLMRPLAQT